MRDQRQNCFIKTFGNKWYTYCLDEWIFKYEFSKETLTEHFKTHSLKGFGVEQMNAGIVAAGAVLHYFRETQHPQLESYFIN